MQQGSYFGSAVRHVLGDVRARVLVEDLNDESILATWSHSPRTGDVNDYHLIRSWEQCRSSLDFGTPKFSDNKSPVYSGVTPCRGLSQLINAFQYWRGFVRNFR